MVKTLSAITHTQILNWYRMANRPILLLPEPVLTEKARRFGGGAPIGKPTPDQQHRRLQKKFADIANSFKSLQASTQGIEPEQVLVFETIGEHVENLAKAISKVPGLEWLSEFDLEDVAPQEGFSNKKAPDEDIPCRLYAVMANQHGITKLLSLWNEWHTNPDKRATTGFGPFKNVFIHLRDLRRWSVEDRLHETRVIEYWEENLSFGQSAIRFEVELWFRSDSQSRDQSQRQLQQLVEASSGRLVTHAVIPEIQYHGILAELPADLVRQTVDDIRNEQFTELLRCNDVMFFRPHAQAHFRHSDSEQDLESVDPGNPPSPTMGPPVVALLDGLPLEKHSTLDGRVIIDDPDDFRAGYAPLQQQHATAMASLICHGELESPGTPLTRPVYSRPILQPSSGFQGDSYESVPNNVLLVDLIHRAIRRLKDHDGDEPPVAPEVKIVNLSVADPYRPFVREMSPLARLLDWLAWHYNLLILVSSGNQTQDVVLTTDETAWQDMEPEALATETLLTLRDDQRLRRAFSPSESVNALTVGALHADKSTPRAGDRRVDLLGGSRLPSPLSTISSGYLMSVKPDIYFPGGRQYFNTPLPGAEGETKFTISTASSPPGLKVASPGIQPLELNRCTYICGTSP